MDALMERGATLQKSVALNELVTFPTTPTGTEAAYEAGPTDDTTLALRKGFRTARDLGFHMTGGLLDSPTALSGEWLNLILALVGSDFRFETEAPISRLMTSDPADLAAAQASQRHGEKLWPVIAMAFGAPVGAAPEGAISTTGNRAVSQLRTGEALLPKREAALSSGARPLSAASVPELGFIARDPRTMATEQSLTKLAAKAQHAPARFKTLFSEAIKRANQTVVREHSRPIATSAENVYFTWEYTNRGVERTLWGVRGIVSDTFSYRVFPDTCETQLFRRYLALREVPARELVPPHGPAQGAVQGSGLPVSPMDLLRVYVEKFATWLRRDGEKPLPGGTPTPTAWPAMLASWEEILANQANLFRLGHLSKENFHNAIKAANEHLLRSATITITRSSGIVETARLTWKYAVKDGEITIEATLAGPKNRLEVSAIFRESDLTRVEDRAEHLKALYRQFADLW